MTGITEKTGKMTENIFPARFFNIFEFVLCNIDSNLFLGYTATRTIYAN